MATKTVKFLFEHFGQNSTSAKDLLKVYVPGEVDLTETVSVCFSSDMDMLVETTRYEVREIELPEWLDPTAYEHTHVFYRYFWEMGGDMEWPEAWQVGLALSGFGEAQKLACIKILGQKSFRSELRRSLRAQLETWLNTPVEERKFKSPFSPKQWNALIGPYGDREAKGLCSSLYYRHRYHAEGVKVEA